MDYDWRIYNKKADFSGIGTRLGVDPVVVRVIRNRGVESEEEMHRYLYGSPADLPAPALLRGTAEAAALIDRKIREGKKIRIVSDYDVDGVMSCYILLDGLKKLGAAVDYDIPDRIRDGYGINPGMVEKAAEEGIDTIITCDNGIAANAAAALAREKGMTFVVTDHHEPQEELPAADVMIDPHLPGETYPFPDICGAVVAWKFLQVLSQKMGSPLPAEAYMEFVAAATVCDVMPLLGENRILVREGLRKMPDTENTGLQALIRATGQEGKALTAYSLGFVIGPAINAMGRLGSAKNAVELFLTENPAFAAQRAEEMKALNDSRKAMTERGAARAIALLRENTDRVIVIREPELHESLAGIVAGRLKEAFWRPAIVLTEAEDGRLKGSARSIPGYNIFEELTKVSDLLDHFGGHPAAAGLTLMPENEEKLRRTLNENAVMTPDMLTPRLMIDVPMPMDYAYMRLAEQLAALGPFGTGNEEPLFAERNMEVLGARIYGKNKNVMSLRVKSASGQVYELTSFEPEEFQNDIKLWFSDEVCDKIIKGYRTRVMLDVAYQLEINEYNGQRSMRFKLKAYRRASGGEG